MEKYVLFFSHSPQIQWFSLIANILEEEFHISSKLFVIGEADELEGRQTKRFAEVINLVACEDNEMSINEAKQILVKIEERVGHQFVQRDMAMDRHFHEARWDGDRKTIFGAKVAKNIEKIISQNGEPMFAMGEENTFPYRLARRMVTCDYCIIHMVGHIYDRFFFEYSMYQQWVKCIEKYEEFESQGVPSKLESEANSLLSQFVKQRQRPIDMELFLERGGNALASRITSGAFFNSLKQALRLVRSKADYWNPAFNIGRYSFLPSKVRRLFGEYLKVKNYNKLALSALPSNQRYAVYFAHVEPEQTIDGLAFEYRDQIATAKTIAASLPADMLLLFKEHPGMVGQRPSEYYNELAEAHNILLLHDSIDSYEVINNSELIFTLSGSVSLEAMFQGKPAIVLGEIYFTRFKGIYKVENIRELPETTREILYDKDAGATRKDAIKALAAMIEGSYPGKLSDRYTMEEMIAESNISKLKNALKAEFSFKSNED